MEPVHVLSTMCFPEEWLDGLRAVSPRLVVTQYSATSAGEVPLHVLQRADVLHTGSVFPDPALVPRLRWVQLDTSGVDHVLRTPLWRSDVAITTLNGVAPPTMAEYALMMMLAFAHRLPLMLEHQARAEWPSPAERWRRFMPQELRGATVGIVGYGSIGREVGRIPLDVFEQEPLPADSPLWTMENVIISPHVAGFTPRYYERVMDLFGENLRRYLAGEPLLNQAQREWAY